ncbi:hypothetical protein LZZ85_09880 [Terrimonas sp. NA20]|uniref:Uncharacterized protein n=1 Tax=Terrimonas ginsenosidimutans TaxID=2908004 RepID=A0ABS9KQJ1_9BACT|nr:hypothetical protein [Terrimonas ginsenosidimutans]MCG2614592.1 hypothetical protein [Terrimonas ginsenosidimutans]
MNEESLKKAREELKKKAQECKGNGMKWPKGSVTGSSLHQIIRTPEQAKRFMKMLNNAHREAE